MSVPSARGNESVLTEIRQSIASVSGVESVDSNAVTGSLLVHYNPALHGRFHRRLSEHCERDDLVTLSPPTITSADEFAEKAEKEAEFLAAHSMVALAMVNAVRHFDSLIKRATGNMLDLRVLLPMGLAFWAFYKSGSKLSTPLWVTLGISAFNAFVALHYPPKRSRETA